MALAGNIKRPAWRVTVDGGDITATLSTRLISLSLSDNRGFEADTLELTLDDGDGRLALPRRGAVVALWLGWAGEPLEDKGRYIVDEVECSGTPDQLAIRARSADLRAGLTRKREQSWHGVTLGDLVKAIAGRNALEAVVSAALAATTIDHLDQADESDAALLSRLARELDAIATVKAGRLLFISAGAGTSAGGVALPAVTLTRASGDRHRFTVADRAGYTAVRANWHDPKLGERAYIIIGDEQIDGSTASPTEPSAANAKTLRHIYANRTNATRAAKAEWQRIQRGMAEFSLTLAQGRADLFPEVPVTVQGFKPEIDSTGWIVTRVTHTLSNDGFRTELDLEIKPADA